MAICGPWLLTLCIPIHAQESKKPFTVADEIGLTLFIPDMGRPNARFSPDGKYFAVYSQRGRLDLNRPEYSLRFYHTSDVESYLEQTRQSQPPRPSWEVHLASDKEGRIIEDWRWLDDSSGVVFLQRVQGNQRIVVAEVANKKLDPVSGPIDDIESYDYRRAGSFVYTAPDPNEIEKLRKERDAERKQSAIVGTGRRLGQLILPDDPVVVQYSLPRACLWAVAGGKLIKLKHDNAAIFPRGDLSLSPDGRSLVTVLPVSDVPKSWQSLYPPPVKSNQNRIHAGHESAKQYVRINLRTVSIQSITDAPLASDAGWPVDGTPSWSSDGRAVLLPGTYVSSQTGKPSRPCVAVVNVVQGTRTCVEMLTAENEPNHHTVSGAHFLRGDRTRVVVTYWKPNGLTGSTEYRAEEDGTWNAIGQGSGATDTHREGMEIRIKQDIDQPPLLVASRNYTSRVIWDPNPQLKDIELGEATIIRWKDKADRQFKGGLFKPPGYKTGQRYPLVIQTHGLYEGFFFPSGPGMPTAFAARALAAVGIVVLQVDENCPFGTEEGPCAASAYQSAVEKLVADGVVDPERIGIIGFSRSCYYVVETLTTAAFQVRAASITSGLMFDYWQYAFGPDRGEGDAVIGVPPFGEGLQQWVKHSPGFNLDKVSAPLMVVGQGPDVLLTMWATYSGLRQLHKPVDLIMLNSDEHVLTNPKVRIASQQGSVDWFRFWLQDYEDPDPAKADQYKRWRELKELQAENERKAAVASGSSPSLPTQ